MTRMVPAARSEWVDPQLKMSGKHMLQVFFVAAKQVDVRWLMFVCCVVVLLGAREQQTNKCKSQSPSCALYLSEWFCGWLKMPLVPLSILESGEFQATDLYQVPQDHPTIYGTST